MKEEQFIIMYVGHHNRNEMEIFITLTKYNTCQWREEGNRC